MNFVGDSIQFIPSPDPMVYISVFICSLFFSPLDRKPHEEGITALFLVARIESGTETVLSKYFLNGSKNALISPGHEDGWPEWFCFVLFFVLFLVAPRSLRVLSSPTRDRIRAPSVKAWSPNHQTTREFPGREWFDSPVSLTSLQLLGAPV